MPDFSVEIGLILPAKPASSSTVWGIHPVTRGQADLFSFLATPSLKGETNLSLQGLLSSRFQMMLAEASGGGLFSTSERW